ncbi:hypothetical protein EYF80_020174 [Liparis tanakae]|uniref:Uncharacterized protein n=1 Tax=Liparis tanakae TaxID=230148 RepID=A0A4Z2HV41_9TELE|nr:hypothetical protein EYF80_020174 [Liparis tanakae]
MDSPYIKKLSQPVSLMLGVVEIWRHKPLPSCQDGQRCLVEGREHRDFLLTPAALNMPKTNVDQTSPNSLKND